MFATPALAQAPGGAASGSGGAIMFLLQFVALGLIFYFLIIRPQQKKAKEHRARVDAVRKGDEVVTAGGVIGKVTRVEDNIAEVEIASGVRIRIVKATLSDIQPAGGVKPAND